VSRVLAPGGTLIIADSNNARCRARRHDVYDLWEQFETGFHAPSEGVAGRKHYALKRLEIIRDQLPDLADEAARELALRTHGMTREQLVGAVSAYRRSEAMPEQTYRRGQSQLIPKAGCSNVCWIRLSWPAGSGPWGSMQGPTVTGWGR